LFLDGGFIIKVNDIESASGGVMIGIDLVDEPISECEKLCVLGRQRARAQGAAAPLQPPAALGGVGGSGVVVVVSGRHVGCWWLVFDSLETK